MGIYDKYLIVTDMDGTLQDYDGIMPEVNKEAIRKFTANGGHFAVATGRTHTNAARYLTGIPINTPCIFYNGSMLYDRQANKSLKLCSLDGEIWRKFVAHCLKTFPETCMEVYTEDNCYVVSDPKYDDPKMRQEKYNYTHKSLEEIKDLVWLKFFVCGEKELLQQVENEAEKFGIKEISTSFYSAAVYFEFVAKDVSKGAMLEVLKNLPENKGRTVIACGDYPNDNHMLKVADIGVASANAHPDTLASADRIGCHCKDGLLAEVINSL